MACPFHVAIGVTSAEANRAQRDALRREYATHTCLSTTFLLDADRRSEASDWNASDVVLVENVSSHCVDKSLTWWSIARRRSPYARYIVKTDDDALIRFDRLLRVLHALRHHTHVYTGPHGFSSFNTTQQRGSCYAYGPKRALKMRHTLCKNDVGPYPFAYGPLIVMSAQLVDRVAQLDGFLRRRRQQCKNEDRIVGHSVSRVENVTFMSLGPNALRNDNGAVFVTHHVKGATFTSRLWAHWPARVNVSCRDWRYRVPRWNEFDCCRDWTMCVLRRSTDM